MGRTTLRGSAVIWRNRRCCFGRRGTAATPKGHGVGKFACAWPAATIRADAGRPLRLIFCREESSACSEQLVLPAFGKSVTLPRGEAVAVDLPAMGPGEYEFIDGMGIPRGRLLVTPLALGGRSHQDERGEPGTAQLLSTTPLGEGRIRSGDAWHTDTP